MENDLNNNNNNNLQLPLSVKEELAVINERLKKHRDHTTSLEAKVRLELAADLIRTATVWIKE